MIAQRYEFFGGPMDGDVRVTTNTDMYFTSRHEGLVHGYHRVVEQFDYLGLVTELPAMKVYQLRVGHKQQ